MSSLPLSDAQDKALVIRLKDKAQRREAFSELVSLYAKPLYAQIRRLVLTHADTNDVLQEVLLKAWDGLDNYRGDSKIYTWLYRIAYHESLNHLRRLQRKRQYEVDINDGNEYLIENLIANPYFDGDELEANFQKAIAKLPPKQKQVFLLRYYDELQYSQIAEITGTSEGALKASYHHALKKIEKELIGE